MKPRSECRCRCHSHPGVKHVIACCWPDRPDFRGPRSPKDFDDLYQQPMPPEEDEKK